MALVGLVALGFVRYLDGLRPIEWKKFSRTAVQSANAKGRNVLVSFSADWTLSARMQEVLIDTPAVRRALRSKGIVPMRADWSHFDPEITEELKALRQKSIPLLVIYPASGREPLVLNDYDGFLTPDQLAAVLGEL